MQIFLNKTARTKNNLLQKYFNNKPEPKANRRISKHYSITIKNKINKTMKKIEKKNRYKRNIYKLLYDQIHTDIAEIDKQINTGRNYIVPYSILKSNKIKNSYIFNKKNSKAFESQNEENKSIKRNDSKIINLKKFHSNDINNSIIAKSKTLNKINKKDYKSNTLISFSKFKNNNNNTPNLKSRNKAKINIIKAITDNNINTNDNLLYNTLYQDIDKDFENDYKNKQNIFLKNNENSNTERNNTKLNSKNVTKTSLYRVALETPQKKRKKILYISYDRKWYLRNKFIYIKLDKLEIENNYIQSQIIGDQYALINENIKIITSKYLVDKEIIIKFNSTNFPQQQIINIDMEESIGLMIEISYILLEKYEVNLENFITQIIKKPKKGEYKLVDDEKKEFNINLSLFTEASSFLSISYKSYTILLQKDEYYKINNLNFDKIYQYLDRLRLSTNKIILDMKNMYNGSNIQEKRIIKECIQKIIKIKQQKNIHEKKKKLDCHRKFGAFRSGIDPFKYKGKLKMKITEEKEIIMRINQALGKKNNIKKNFNNVKKFDIGSKLVSDLMKYGTSEFRQFIISERIRRKIYDKEKEDDNSNDN